jgi:hypothetical protein
MVNSAPFDPYLSVVPTASSQFLVSAPFVQSVVRVVPKAGSEGQAVEESARLCRGEGVKGHTLFSRVAVCECLGIDSEEKGSRSCES